MERTVLFPYLRQSDVPIISVDTKNGDLSYVWKGETFGIQTISNFTFYLSPTIATGDCFLPSPSSVTFSGAPFRSMAA